LNFLVQVLEHNNLYKIKSASNTMNKWFEILLGLVFVVAAILVGFYYPSWLSAALAVLKGGVLWFLLGVGLLLVLLGISELKQ
jgi:predicted phage tail protein